MLSDLETTSSYLVLGRLDDLGVAMAGVGDTNAAGEVQQLATCNNEDEQGAIAHVRKRKGRTKKEKRQKKRGHVPQAV